MTAIHNVSQQQNIQSSVSAQQNSSKVQSSQQPSQYGYDLVTLSTSVAPSAAASGSRNSDGTTQYAESTENGSRFVMAAKNQTVKPVNDDDKHQNNKEAYDLLKLAAGVKGMLAGLVGVITKGEV